MICFLLGILSAIARKMAGNQERTFIMVKPDGVQRGIVGEILKRFETKGFKLVALKMLWVSSNPIKFCYTKFYMRTMWHTYVRLCNFFVVPIQVSAQFS